MSGLEKKNKTGNGNDSNSNNENIKRAKKEAKKMEENIVALQAETKKLRRETAKLKASSTPKSAPLKVNNSGRLSILAESRAKAKQTNKEKAASAAAAFVAAFVPKTNADRADRLVQMTLSECYQYLRTITNPTQSNDIKRRAIDLLLITIYKFKGTIYSLLEEYKEDNESNYKQKHDVYIDSFDKLKRSFVMYLSDVLKTTTKVLIPEGYEKELQDKYMSTIRNTFKKLEPYTDKNYKDIRNEYREFMKVITEADKYDLTKSGTSAKSHAVTKKGGFIQRRSRKRCSTRRR